MDAQEKRQESKDHRTAMLQAMGIGQWYERGVPQIAVEQSSSVPDSSPIVQPIPETSKVKPAASIPPVSASEEVAKDSTPEPVEIIEFAWIKGQTGMLACALGADRAMLKYLKDIVVFADWARGQTGGMSHGEFRWPQLLETAGTPTRSLSVFFDKHFPANDSAASNLSANKFWLALAGEVSPFMSKWLTELPLIVIELPDLQQSIAATDSKKAIWQCLTPNR